MDRRRFLTGAAVLPALARAEVSRASQALGEPATSIATGQPMGARFALTLNRVLHGNGPAYTQDFLLEDVRGTKGRRFTEFSGDVSGRWIGALASASAEYGETIPQLGQMVERTIALQHPEGFFGKSFDFDHPGDEDLALLWGNGRLLVGLMEYYALHPDTAVLASARRLGNILVRLGPKYNSTAMAEEFSASHFASSYICWTQQTEGLALLYAATRDARYRDLCVQIGERIQRRPADHVHGYLCSVRGMLALYETTHDAAQLQMVEAAWQDVQQSGDVLITGAVPEAWSPKRLRTEGCAECDWLRLNLALWRLTGNPAYVDIAEKIIFNEFAMNQFSTGDFGHAQLDEAGIPHRVVVRAWWCCTLHGLRAFSDVHRHVFRTKDEELFYDLPVDGSIRSANVSVEATSRLAEDGTVSLRILGASPGHTLTLRQPGWASALELKRNGIAVPGLSVRGLAKGDVVSATYLMALADRQAGASVKLEKRRSFFYGPWLLGVSSAANPGYFNELQADNLLIVHSARGIQDAPAYPFAIPVAATEVSYVPAEYPEQTSRVQLKPVAEQTATLPAQWEMAFLVKESTA